MELNQNAIIALVIGALGLFVVAFLTVKEVSDDAGTGSSGDTAAGQGEAQA